ncbi:hypothetical protein RFI_34907 [Reticulomyxa filosa]|uniref:Uncharacterized protein n=1 Tax=Reticulomyxa filosa TaxID=46433 RepID=X6LN01_RETFI|nr:hypothetical protein RFI_34907 [Reticulomyxa filosa]|eukprot:ETO02522.1 hypothetical protein RFI_34907 [Reticulomyxa filosa]
MKKKKEDEKQSNNSSKRSVGARSQGVGKQEGVAPKTIEMVLDLHIFATLDCAYADGMNRWCSKKEKSENRAKWWSCCCETQSRHRPQEEKIMNRRKKKAKFDS